MFLIEFLLFDRIPLIFLKKVELYLADYWVNDTLMTVAARKKKLTKFN